MPFQLHMIQFHELALLFHNQKLPMKTIDFVWCLGPTLANMGPYSQATTEATKSIVDIGLCQLLTY